MCVEHYHHKSYHLKQELECEVNDKPFTFEIIFPPRIFSAFIFGKHVHSSQFELSCTMIIVYSTHTRCDHFSTLIKTRCRPITLGQACRSNVIIEMERFIEYQNGYIAAGQIEQRRFVCSKIIIFIMLDSQGHSRMENVFLKSRSLSRGSYACMSSNNLNFVS